MPVTGLYFCPDSGTTQNPAQGVADRLAKKFQPQVIGKWTLEHRLLRETGGPTGLQTGAATSSVSNAAPRFMQYLDLSYHPGKKLCLVDKAIVTIDAEFETMLTTKLQGMWAMRQTLKAEGQKYELDDFSVRIGTLSQGSVIKGVIVEIEYTPCSYIEQGEPIIRNFLERLALPSGPQVRVYINPMGGAKGREFTILDTGMQYMELLRLR